MSKTSPTIYIVIPVYNETRIIKNIIKHIAQVGYANIIAVDDGSTDATPAAIKQTTAIYIHHRLNRGKGAAIKTGLAAAKQLGADIVVTMDSDGQHNPYDISHLVEPIIRGESEVTLGIRTKNRMQMPWHKKIINAIADNVTYLTSGIRVHDSQSGFRAYSRRALEVINTRSDRYEFESEVIREIAYYQLSYKEVPITTIYTDYASRKPQKQNFTNGLITLYKLIWNIFS